MKSLFIGLFLFTQTFHLSYCQKYNFGVTIGANYFNRTDDNTTKTTQAASNDVILSNISKNYDYSVGYQFGLTTQRSLGKDYLLRLDLTFTKYHLGLTSNYQERDPFYGLYYINFKRYNMSLISFSIPLNLVKQIKLGEGKLDLSAGIQFDYYLSGKLQPINTLDNPFSSTNETVENISITNSISTSNPSYQYNYKSFPERGATKPMSFALNIGLGYQLGRVLFSTQYVLGITDIDPVAGKEGVAYQSGFKINTFCFFGKLGSN